MWYTDGLVSVTNNSASVVGSGTRFLDNARNGDAFIGPDGLLYQVLNIVSQTQMAIKPNYKSASATGQAYSIAPIQGYVKMAADRLWQILNQLTPGDSGAPPIIISATAPPSPVPLMTWVDVSGNTPVERLRNDANTAWVVIRPDYRVPFGTAATMAATSSATPPNGQLWRTNDLIKQTGNTDRNAGRVALAENVALLGGGNIYSANSMTVQTLAAGVGSAITDRIWPVSSLPDLGINWGAGTTHIVQHRLGGASADANVRGWAYTSFDTTPILSMTNAGVVAGAPINGFLGAGTVNATGLYENGRRVGVPESGTFVPVVEGSIAAGSASYSAPRAGMYTKIGNRVDISMILSYSGHTGTGNMQISGLPFSRNSNAAAGGVANAYAAGMQFPEGDFLAPLIDSNTNVLMRSCRGGRSFFNVPMSGNAAVTSIVISATYFTNE